MLKLKPFWITLISIILFVIGMFLGTKSDWWNTEGRKTPLDGERYYESHDEEESAAEPESSVMEAHEAVEAEDEEEEEHEAEGVVSGGTTVQEALDMGIPLDVIEEILEGPVEDTGWSIQTVAKERGLQFGVVKDELNALLVP